MSSNKLAIIGAGDLGQLIAHHAIYCGYTVVGFYDDTLPKGSLKGNYSILGNLAEIEQDFKSKSFDFLMIGIGYKHMNARQLIFERFESLEIPFATLIHPSCFVDASSSVSPGSFLLPGCVIDRGVSIGKNVLLNTACTVAHDTKVGDHSFLAPRVALAGFIKIGDRCVLGINTTVIDNIDIASGAQTGGGAVVIKNLVEPGLFVGIPAKKIK